MKRILILIVVTWFVAVTVLESAVCAFCVVMSESSDETVEIAAAETSSCQSRCASSGNCRKSAPTQQSCQPASPKATPVPLSLDQKSFVTTCCVCRYAMPSLSPGLDERRPLKKGNISNYCSLVQIFEDDISSKSISSASIPQSVHQTICSTVLLL